MNADGLKAVIFDIGDTLIPATRIGIESLSDAVEKLERDQLIADPAAFKRTYAEVDSATTRPHVNHLFSSHAIAQEVVERLGYDRPQRLAIAFVAVYRDGVRRRINRDADVVQAVAALKQAGLMVAVVTDGSAVHQTETLYRLGLLPLLDSVTVSEECGEEKPSPGIFEAALQGLGVREPREVLMIGDSLHRDIAGAGALGLRTAITIEYSSARIAESNEWSTDLVIENLRDWLVGFIKEIR